MKLIELHILQSFPVSCLNRDDVGAPKSAVFGGVNRARISSQSLKRAIRFKIKDEFSEAAFGGKRSRHVAARLADILSAKHKIDQERAIEMACAVAGVLDKKEGKPLRSDKPLTETLIFLSPSELEALAELAVKEFGPTGSIAADKKAIVAACRKATRLDATDISFFGRMVAADPSLNIEGAAMFGHALSVHRADNDLDFFSAVGEPDDPSEHSGADHINTLEFTSALYYRYCAVNLGLLADEHHLAGLTPEQRQAAMNGFIRAVLTAVPGARKNSMNAHTFPSFVLGVVKDKGQPVQLINAFEEPLSSWDTKQRGGWEKTAIEKLKSHHEALKKTWNVETAAEISIPESDLNAFCETLCGHVN